MSRMTRDNWLAYSIFRECDGLMKAEEFRHKAQKRNAERGFNNLPTEPQWTYVTGDCDSYIEKRFFPGLDSADDLERIYDAIYIDRPVSPYDCTGKPFTVSISIHCVPDGLWVYHTVGYDV